MIILHIILGILLADFLSGFIHWIQDRYATPNWRLVGSAVADAHAHHADPSRFLQASFLKRNGATMILVACIGLILALFGGLNAITITALIVGALANEIHAMTHHNKVGWWVVILQRIGLMQSPAHHQGHHIPRSSQRYCVITNYLNPVLDRMGFWKRLEIALFFGSICRILPNGEL